MSSKFPKQLDSLINIQKKQLSIPQALQKPSIKSSIDALQDTILSKTPSVVMSASTPFVIPPGDGTSTGLLFSDTSGAYTLSAAIITGCWIFLRSGFWMYLPANFGGSSYPAGWYWSVMTSDTAGILYTDRYESGSTIGPIVPTAFTVNLTGRLTSVITEVVGPTGFNIYAGLMGKSGLLTSFWKLLGNITGTKTVKQLVGSTEIVQVNTTTFPILEMVSTSRNTGVENNQVNTRSPGTGPLGIGVSGTATLLGAAFEATAINFAVDQVTTVTLKTSVNTACLVLLGCTSVVYPGD